MIPSGGWLAEGQNLNSSVDNIPLPVPFQGTYVDSNRRGSPGDLITQVDGQATSMLSKQASTFTVTLQQYGTEGVVLIDRME